MNKKDNFDELYKYLSYPLNDELNIFEIGMPLKSKKINTHMNIIAYNESTLQSWLESRNTTNNYGTNKICILKIPSYYFGYKKAENEYTPCVPFVKTFFDYKNGEKNYIIPELILGIYNIETKEYKENPNYNLNFNPNGLQFIDEQISNMKASCAPGVADYALYRRFIPYDELLEQDKLNGVFNATIEFYNNLAKDNPNKRNQPVDYPRKSLKPNNHKFRQ